MYITIDGGTSNTRVYTIENGNVKLISKAAVGAHNSNGLRRFLKETLSDIDAGRIDAIIASGMITSANGLLEVRHIPAPAGLQELHCAMQEALFPDICSVPFTFIPGVKIDSGKIENADIMRGEETELMGLGEIYANTAYILPGTHSKCILTDIRGKIFDFFTMMTGELLEAVKKSTIIGKSFEYFEVFDEKSLSDGFEYASENGINETLFKCRIMDILLGKSQTEIYSFCLGAVLSGELNRIAKVKADRFVFGGKRTLRIPESLLFKKYFGKTTVCLDDSVCSNAAPLGAVKIYENKF